MQKKNNIKLIKIIIQIKIIKWKIFNNNKETNKIML